MANPLTAAEMLWALRKEGLAPVEVREWATHHRGHKGPFGPVHGVMIHHTVTGPNVMDTVNLCYDGHSALPGPLCHAVAGKDGRIYLVGRGRANHAGAGDPDVLAAVIQEKTALPPDNEATADGNSYFYGIEIQNLGDGLDPYPMAQYEATVKYAAAICRAHGWSERSVIGHKEWQPGKIDPTFNMAEFRVAVGRRLLKTPGATPAPSTPATTEATMKFTSLAMTDAPLTIPAGESRTVYWDAEYQDGSGDHGTGGKTIISGEHFTGTVALVFDSLPAGVYARMVHELDAGGRSSDYAAEATRTSFAFPYTGRVAEDRNLVFEIENTSAYPVVLNWAAVRGGTWAL